MYPKAVLPNGLRVVTHSMKERGSISLGFWIGVGGRYEEDKIKGAAHFLEHISFKGSRKYSCAEIKESIEGVGGSLNAFTGEEQTCYYAKIPSKHLEMTFDILADMVFFPKIDPKDVAKEGAVIVEEIKMYRDQPQYYVSELLDELLWPEHPLGKSLTGTPETVSAMTSKDLLAFHSSHYVPGNIVIAAAGDLKQEEMAALVRKKVNKLQSPARSSYLPADNAQAKPHARFFFKAIEQMHLALGMLGCDEDHKDRYVLTLLNIILGGNMSSRLFDELREKRGLAYSIFSYAKTLHDTGIFSIRAGVENNKTVEAFGVILKELEKVKISGVTEDEFKRAKEYLMGQLLLGLEDTMDHMLWIGESLISKNKTKTLAVVIRELEKITRADVQRVARDVFKENCFNLAVVGPITDKQKKDLGELLGINEF